MNEIIARIRRSIHASSNDIIRNALIRASQVPACASYPSIRNIRRHRQ